MRSDSQVSQYSLSIPLIVTPVRASGNQFELRLGINKARDQPGARHSIGVKSLACAPNAFPNSPLERAA
jgi:hypothetical protein